MERETGSSMPETQKRQNHTVQWVAGIVILVVAIVIALVLASVDIEEEFLPSFDPKLKDIEETSTEIEPGQIRTDVPKGYVVRDFPEGMLLAIETSDLAEGGDNIMYRVLSTDDVRESYSITYTNNGDKFSTVSYLSGGSVFENIEMFRRYFNDNGWTIEQRANPDTDERTYYLARRSNETANVTFIPQDSGVMIQATYTLLVISEE